MELAQGSTLGLVKASTMREVQEWIAYRICGNLFLVMTLVLLGVVILIVIDGNNQNHWITTALYVTFGTDTGDEFNFIVGTGGCVLLCFIGIFMVVQSSKKNALKETEVSL